MTFGNEKHTAVLPSPRGIRRACANELYRTIKRLKIHVPEARVKEAEQLYFRRVIGHLVWISANKSNRKALADWWDEAVCGDIAALWNVDTSRLSEAFREAFGA